MNVAILIDTLVGGGAERVVQRLAVGMARRGHHPFIYCLKAAGLPVQPLAAAGVVVRELRSFGRDPGLVWRLARLLRADRVQVVHAHSCAAAVWAFPVTRLLRIPLLHVRHGWPLGQPGRYARLADRLSPWVDRLAVCCQTGLDRLPAGRGAARAAFLPDGVDPPTTTPAAARTLLAGLCGDSPGGRIVLTVANVRPEKDIRGLVQAFARLRRTDPDVRLVCVGDVLDRAYWAAVQRDIRRLQLADVVRFPGAFDGASRLMPAADVFCLSSRTEALPNVILEAMAQRVPIVATAVGDIGRLDLRRRAAEELPAGRGADDGLLLRHEETALLVPPGDPDALAAALHRALADPAAARIRAARAAEVHAARFTTECMVRRYERIYAECVRQRHRQAKPYNAGGVQASSVRPPQTSARGRRAPLGVLMLGPAPPAIGGMVTSIGLLMKSPLAGRYRLHRLAAPLDPEGHKRHAAPQTKEHGRAAGALRAVVRHASALVRLARLITTRRIDVVHIHTCSFFTFYRNLLDLVVARLLGRRVVLHIRGNLFDRFCAESGKLGRRLIRRGLEAADAVIVLSRGWQAALRPYAGRARIAVVPNAFDPEAIAAPVPTGEQRMANERRRTGQAPAEPAGTGERRTANSDGRLTPPPGAPAARPSCAVRHPPLPERPQPVTGVSAPAAPADRSPSDRACRFLFLALVREIKGVGELIEAARRLRERGVRFELCIAGPATDGDGERWRRQVRDAGLDRIVWFTGPVTGGTKARLLASADCFVHPSRSEGLPNSILEAGAAGLPIIATAVGAVPEVLAPPDLPSADDGTPLGLLVPPRDPAALADAMERLATDAGLRRRMGARVRERFRAEYSLERLAERMAPIYEEVTSGK